MRRERGRHLRVGATALLALAIIGGCARNTGTAERADDDGPREPAPGAPGVVVNVYDCADGERVVLEGLGRDTIRLHRDDQRHTLDRIDGDAEYAYTGDERAWEVRGSDGKLTLPDNHRVRCGESPRAAVWEEARLRGVSYRAEGRDRSWELEIEQRTLTFRHRDRAEPARIDDVDWDGKGALALDSDDAEVRLEPVAGRCERARPELRPLRLIVDDRLLEGCGRFLDATHGSNE